jgi:hypothetical protein
VEHQWFTVTDSDGRFRLPSVLPPGEYTVAAVHLKAGESVQTVNLTDGDAPVLSFTLDVPPALAHSPAP